MMEHPFFNFKMEQIEEFRSHRQRRRVRCASSKSASLLVVDYWFSERVTRLAWRCLHAVWCRLPKSWCYSLGINKMQSIDWHMRRIVVQLPNLLTGLRVTRLIVYLRNWVIRCDQSVSCISSAVLKKETNLFSNWFEPESPLLDQFLLNRPNRRRSFDNSNSNAPLVMLAPVEPQKEKRCSYPDSFRDNVIQMSELFWRCLVILERFYGLNCNMFAFVSESTTPQRVPFPQLAALPIFEDCWIWAWFFWWCRTSA